MINLLFIFVSFLVAFLFTKKMHIKKKFSQEFLFLLVS